MASTLVNVALSSIKPPNASYYGKIDNSNPVISAANREIKEVKAYFSKKLAGAVQSDEACSRGPNWLFEIWNKYEPRLPAKHFYNKLIDMGDYLKDVGAEDVASWQCYRRYLVTRYKEIPSSHVGNALAYKDAFFRSTEKHEDHVLTAKALLGLYMSDFASLCKRDQGLLNVESVPECISILKGLQTFMQCLMVDESFCWMVYNCTILIYSICRSLMTANSSIKAIDYLLWAAMCMESVVPLLGVKYLTWRVTLYAAICLAYYDCNAGHHAEAFARRALNKLQELSELERLSESTYSFETQCIFRQATAKMASMIFKRTVYETRRKQKGFLRPKVRTTVKDMAQMSWPRTTTEKLLSDMFEGSAAQFLAVLEALSSSNRRTFHNAPYSNESEMLEVTSELFYAGKEIISGGGGTTNANASGNDQVILAAIQNDASLIDLAAAGRDGVTLSSVVRFIKLAFCYDMWTVFDSLLDCTLIYIKKYAQPSENDQQDSNSGTELCLALMLVMQRLTRNQSGLKVPVLGSNAVSGDDEAYDSRITQGTTSTPSVQINDDLVNLAETVLFCISEPKVFQPQGLDGDILIDKDMIMDASLLLWQKCKQAIGKQQATAKRDFGGNLMKTGDPNKWLHILTVVHTALLWCDVGLVDPTLMAEVCLRLSVALEASASSDSTGLNYNDGVSQAASRMTVYSTTQATPNAQLAKALTVLKSGFEVISAGRANDAKDDGRLVADTLWMSKFEQLAECKVSESVAFIRDLVIEMLVVYYRIAFRLVERRPVRKAVTPRSRYSTPRTTVSSKPTTAGEQLTVLTEKKIKESVGSSYLCRAIFLMEKASQSGVNEGEARDLLEKSMRAIESAQEEEKRIFEESWLVLNNPYQAEDPSDVPSPPILLSRSDTSMTFKPANFEPIKTEVAWYKIFGRLAAGPNVKVRSNDYYLPGTGDEVPAGADCVLRVSGLKRNHRYVFAVAAYTSDGKLIGGSVGKTGQPIVASHPLSCLAVWGHLAHASYKLGYPAISKRACSVLWDIFVSTPGEPPSSTWTSSARRDYALTHYHLNREVAMESSPVLLHHAASAVFVAVDTAVREEELYCDKFCENGPLLTSQLKRVKECERMLVAMEIAAFLNDSSLVLQAVVQTYGLIAPIIQAQVTTTPLLQIALRCMCSLLEVRGLLKQKRSANTSDSLHHMVAALTHYLSSCAKVKGNNQAALAAIETGKTILRGEPSPPPGRKVSTEQHSGKKAKLKKGMSVEPLSEKSKASLAELATLEEHLADLSKEVRTPEEMVGTEDSNMVLTKLSRMRSIVGFREVSKFKRRNRFLEFFVVVLRKALRTMNVEMAVECSQDVMTTLHRRNEILAVNQAVVSKQAGGVTVQGEESRKYAAAVAEYSIDGAKKNKKAPGQEKKEKRKGNSPRVKGKGNAVENQEDAEKKQAMAALASHLGKYYRNYLKKKRFRKILADESAYKTEFNLLNGLLHLQIFLDKIRERRNLRGYKLSAHGSFEFLDQEWWSLNTSGALVVGWDDSSRLGAEGKVPKREEEGHLAERGLERAAFYAISSTLAEPKPSSPPLGEEKAARSPSPQTRSPSPVSVVQDHEMWMALDLDAFLPPLKVSFLCFQRGMVLAHRSRHWTLLQNTASAFYSAAMATYQSACDGTEPGFNLKECRDLLCRPMTIAADLLIDMLMIIDDGKEHRSRMFKSIVGNPTAKKGGLSLKFDEHVDDCDLVNILLIKKIVLQAVELLHYATRYEALVDICLKFSELTHNCYYDVIEPLVIHAQARLGERIREFAGEAHPQSHFLDAAKDLGKSGVENRDYLRFQLKTKTDQIKTNVAVGGFIDPESHDVYGGGKRALALSSVPFDVRHSMEQLAEAFHGSQYIARALQHSRKLLVIYLASQHNSASWAKRGSAKKPLESTNGSCVEFSLKADAPHSPAPSDLTKIDFTSTNNVEVLASSQSATVVQSYQRTIELLESHDEYDLVSQASSELGNLHFHLGNSKAAFKWWRQALDQVLRVDDSIHHWRKLIKDDDKAAEELLSTCGLSGCLHAIVVASKIGEFTSPDTAVKSECALLSSHLVRSIFRSTFPHPSADFDYASYEILPSVLQNSLLSQSKTKVTLTSSHVLANCLLNGVDFFSESFRCDVHSLIASLHWLCDHLVQMKFYLQALPAIVLYQYIATFVCRDVQRSVHCRCLKVTLLTELRMYNEASEEMMNLLCGAKLPHSTDVGFAPPEAIATLAMFDVKKPIDDPDNLTILETIASKRLSGQLSISYGPHLTCEVSLCQANFLVRLASSISFIPQKPTMQDLQFVSPETDTSQNRKSVTNQSSRGKRKMSNVQDDARSSFSAFSTSSTSKNVNKLFTMRERPMGLQLLKGMLLAVSEHLISSMMKAFEGESENLVASEVWLSVRSLLLFSEIQQQRQLSTLSAAKAVHALNILQRASIFNDQVQIKLKKPRSAMRGRNVPDEGNDEQGSEHGADFYPVMEEIYRSRLNSRLWLECRLRLCQALTSQVKGLGKIESGAPNNTGLLDHSQVQLYCAEGLAEAEACNDVEMQAFFLIQGASLDGITSNESKHMLEDATSSLDEQAELSTRAVIALAEGTTLLADVSLASGFIASPESLQSYRSAQSVLLLKAMQEGSTIQHFQQGSDLSTLQEPLANHYSYNLGLLAEIKLRIARALTQTFSEDGTNQENAIVAQLLKEAETLSSTSASALPLLLAEINLELGKVQRSLVVTETLPVKIPQASLRKAISLANEGSSDLALMRQAHLEMALLHMHNINQQSHALANQPISERASTSFPCIKEERVETNISSRSLSMDYGVLSEPFETSNSRDRVAESLHAAYHAACGMRRRAILPGDPKVTSVALSTDDRVSLPEFLVVDLATDHTAFTQELIVAEDTGAHPLVTSLKMTSSNISWIHIFMYNVLLQRKSRLATSYARENALDLIAQNGLKSNDPTPQMEGRSTCVRIPLRSSYLQIRLSALNHFLTRHPSYSVTGQVPPALQEPFVAAQWHWSDDRSAVQLLWCVIRKGGSADCNRISVDPKMFENVAEQARTMKKRTDEYFARQAPFSTEVTQRRKSRAKSIQIDPQLEEDWKHVVNQIINLVSTQDEPITTLPFTVTLLTAESVVDLFSVGCCFEMSHPLFKWMSDLLSPK